MKPSKKKTLQTKKSNNLSTPKIDSYFKAAAKHLNLDVDTKTASDPSDEKAIYIDALKKKLQAMDGDGDVACDVEFSHEEDTVNDKKEEDKEKACEAIANKTTFEHEEGAYGVQDTTNGACEPAKCLQCVEWKSKYDDIKKLCLKLTIRNANMDLKYDDLLRTKTCVRPSVPGDAISSRDDFFTAKELRFLDVMPLEKKSDSTFVRHCLEFMYKADLSILCKKSLKGTAEKQHFSDEGIVERFVEGKDPLTPQKVDRARSLFVDRISKADIGAVEYAERIKDAYFNRLIASSLQNISKKN